MPSGVTTQRGLLKTLSSCQKSRTRSASERGGIGRKAKCHQSQMKFSLLKNPMRHEVADPEADGPEQAHPHEAATFFQSRRIAALPAR